MTLPSADRPALLLVGHGTRDPDGQAEFLRLADLVRTQAPERLVEPCFLELAEPSIAAGVGRLLAAGARQITVAPLLLFSAGHAQRDVPEAVAAALAEHGPGDVVVRQAAALDAEPSLVRLSAQRFAEALGEPVDLAQTVAVLIARGSRDPLAAANLERFAAAWQTATGVGQTWLGFVALATPTLDEALRSAGSSGARRVVVVRHFLFAGELPQQVEAAARAAGEKHPGQVWHTTAVLGADRLLAASVLARAAEAERVSP